MPLCAAIATVAAAIRQAVSATFTKRTFVLRSLTAQDCSAQVVATRTSTALIMPQLPRHRLRENHGAPQTPSTGARPRRCLTPAENETRAGRRHAWRGRACPAHYTEMSKLLDEYMKVLGM
jgi:hypothetical protein